MKLNRLLEKKVDIDAEKIKELIAENNRFKSNISDLDNKLSEFTNEDPRTAIQTKIYENEIKNLVLANKQNLLEVSKLATETKNLEKENKKLREELKFMLDSDIAVILQQIKDKDDQIIQMVKLTNEKQKELSAITTKMYELEQI